MAGHRAERLRASRYASSPQTTPLKARLRGVDGGAHYTQPVRSIQGAITGVLLRSLCQIRSPTVPTVFDHPDDSQPSHDLAPFPTGG